MTQDDILATYFTRVGLSAADFLTQHNTYNAWYAALIKENAISAWQRYKAENKLDISVDAFVDNRPYRLLELVDA